MAWKEFMLSYFKHVTEYYGIGLTFSSLTNWNTDNTGLLAWEST